MKIKCKISGAKPGDKLYRNGVEVGYVARVYKNYEVELNLNDTSEAKKFADLMNNHKLIKLK